MANEVKLLGPDGSPLPPTPRRRMPAHSQRAQGLVGSWRGLGGPAYDAADIYDQHLASWNPYLWSPDAEFNIYRDRIVSRIRDLVRNDGWASGAVTRILDNAIGAALRPIAKPNYRYISQALDDKRFDATWAREWSKAADAYWASWAVDDPAGRWCDAARNQDFADLMRTAFRHKLVDGDALAIMRYEKGRVGPGRARYATCIQLIDPDRLSNPQLRFDDQSMRGGVKVDDLGAAVGYYIRKAHEGDWFSAAKAVTWELIPRETPWGRPVTVHDFDCERAGQHRGGGGILLPVLIRMKMLAKYDGVELDSAIINSIFAAYLQSPYDPQLAAEALDDGEKLNAYQKLRRTFHDETNIMLGNSRMPILFPGEEIKTAQGAHPTSNFPAFQSAVIRNFATAVGLSSQQISNDWGDVNYSSARGALLEAWKTLGRRRTTFCSGFAAPVRSCWLEESLERDEYPWPGNEPLDFIDFRGALSRCRWLGPAVGWLDPVAEVQAAIMRMDGALSTLEDEAAQQGLEYEEVLDQRAYEIQMFNEKGIPPPQWAGQLVAKGGLADSTAPGATTKKINAQSDSAKPKKPTPQ